MKILVLITGSSSVELGFLLLQNLQKYKNLELFCVYSDGAKLSYCLENNIKNDFLEFCKIKFNIKNVIFYDNKDLSAPISSGSFGINKTIVAPCSINTLAKIYSGISDNLITRSCAVALKENKKLILAIREMPLSTISLEHMAKLSSLGVIIAPPIYASYAKIKNLKDLQNFFIGKWLDLLEIEHNLYKKWGKF